VRVFWTVDTGIRIVTFVTRVVTFFTVWFIIMSWTFTKWSVFSDTSTTGTVRSGVFTSTTLWFTSWTFNSSLF
jgi:hypothetical protein